MYMNTVVVRYTSVHTHGYSYIGVIVSYTSVHAVQTMYIIYVCVPLTFIINIGVGLDGWLNSGTFLKIVL